MGHCVARVQRVQKVLPAFGRRVQRVVVSPWRAMSIKSALRDFPPGTVILSRRRRISVHAAFETIGDKYRSAGRHGRAFGREGVRLRRRLYRRVVFASLRGRRPFRPRVMVAPFGRRFKKSRPPFPSFRPKRSGVEKSHAPNDRKASPRPPSFRP